jgi:hypothetical protein
MLSEILWAPGRIMVHRGADSHEAATEKTLASLKEALITAAYALIESSRAY